MKKFWNKVITVLMYISIFGLVAFLLVFGFVAWVYFLRLTEWTDRLLP